LWSQSPGRTSYAALGGASHLYGTRLESKLAGPPTPPGFPAVTARPSARPLSPAEHSCCGHASHDAIEPASEILLATEATVRKAPLRQARLPRPPLLLSLFLTVGARAQPQALLVPFQLIQPSC